MSEKEKDELINEIFKIIKINQLVVPILDEYKITDKKSDAIFIAKSSDNSVEQFLSDGSLNENESLEQRIEKIILETTEAMKNNRLLNPQIDFLTDYNTSLFKFKLYLQDNIKDKSIIRQVNAYFLEPRSKCVYEITLAAPPIPLDKANDNILNNLLTSITKILQNVTYSNNPLNL